MTERLFLVFIYHARARSAMLYLGNAKQKNLVLCMFYQYWRDVSLIRNRSMTRCGLYEYMNETLLPVIDDSHHQHAHDLIS